MKNIFFALILLFSISTFAQNNDAQPTDKGQFLVNGALNFNTSKSDQGGSFIEDSSFINFTLSPRVGYFVIDQLAVGLETSFTYSRTEFEFIDNSMLTQNSTIFSAGPFVRYYLKNGLFAEASIGFARQDNLREEEGVDDFESELDFFFYEFGIGYAIFFNNSVSLEPFLSYQFERTTQNEAEIDTSGLNLGVGFTFYF
jgi:outer membrane protein